MAPCLALGAFQAWPVIIVSLYASRKPIEQLQERFSVMGGLLDIDR